MAIVNDIKQTKSFRSSKNKALVNLIYTYNHVTFNQKVVLKKHKLTLETYNVLRILKGSAPKPVNINYIIARMLDKMSNASRLVDRLFILGFVNRTVSTDDRRAVDVVISPAGIKALDKVDADMVKFENCFENFTEEDAEQLSSILDKMRVP
jgi:DNA-binding MarR family transcriptional regulator